MRPLRLRGVLAATAVVAAAAVGCSTAADETGAPVGGAGGGTDEPATAAGPAGAAPDVHEVGAPATAPPRDAYLSDATWPEAAAWIAREADAGRPVVVNFFASWCGPCRSEAPLLREARRDHSEVAFLGINYRDRAADGADFLEQTGLGWPTLRDFDGEIGTALALRGMPTTLAFDASGRLVERRTGEITAGDLEAMITGVTGSGVTG